MKHSDFVRELKNDPDYLAAVEALELNLALSKAVVRGRSLKGWSQAELAKRAGTKQANISRIESGFANPTLDLIHRILKALDLSFQFVEVSSINSEKTVTFVDLPSQLQNWPVKIIAESSISQVQILNGDPK